MSIEDRNSAKKKYWDKAFSPYHPAIEKTTQAVKMAETVIILFFYEQTCLLWKVPSMVWNIYPKHLILVLNWLLLEWLQLKHWAGSRCHKLAANKRGIMCVVKQKAH